MAKNSNGVSHTSKYTKTYTSYSGTDMVATMEVNLPLGNGKSKRVLHVIGELQTLSYSIHMEKMPVRSISSVNAKDYVEGPRTIAGSLVFAVFDRHIILNILNQANNIANDALGTLMDELPPFNITISMTNEYGQKSRMAIYNVRIVDEGQVMSVNDVFTENTYQFVATDIDYLTPDGQESMGVLRGAIEQNIVSRFGLTKHKTTIEKPKANGSKSSSTSGNSSATAKQVGNKLKIATN